MLQKQLGCDINMLILPEMQTPSDNNSFYYNVEFAISILLNM